MFATKCSVEVSEVGSGVEGCVGESEGAGLDLGVAYKCKQSSAATIVA